jgi:hypothetical protein
MGGREKSLCVRQEMKCGSSAIQAVD